MTLKFFVSTMLFSAAAFADSSAKGIFVSGGDRNPATDSTPAVKYSLELIRNGDRRAAAVSQRFQDGDRFRFRFRVNRPGYVYLLNRTVKGDPDTLERYTGTKGIVVVGNDETYTLLYPRNDSGVNNKIRPDRDQMVPEDKYFEMDRIPGIEKLVLVVAPKPLEVQRYFRLASHAPRSGRNDSTDEVTGQLAEMDKNANTEESGANEKGICVGDCDNYAAPRQNDKPMLIDIDLRHFPVAR